LNRGGGGGIKMKSSIVVGEFILLCVVISSVACSVGGLWAV
jgi:hypothetical protein